MNKKRMLDTLCLEEMDLVILREAAEEELERLSLRELAICYEEGTVEERTVIDDYVATMPEDSQLDFRGELIDYMFREDVSP